MRAHITAFQAYNAMYEFLGALYDTVQNDALGALLESLRIKRETGLPVNPEMKTDWMATARNNDSFSSEQAYALMGEFLRKTGARIVLPGMTEVIAYVSLNEHNRAVLQNWEEAITDTLDKGTDWE